MMMAEVANHSKRNHTDSYFSGKAVAVPAAAATSSEEFGSMSSKKPRNASPRLAPVSPKVRTHARTVRCQCPLSPVRTYVRLRSPMAICLAQVFFLVGAAAAAATTVQEKKDKIGERVAALQQLVSPFGKTDTASVLQEASGYIKFLHQQLEVLSSPYMRAPPAAGAAPEVSFRRPSSSSPLMSS
uniref:BHLH domain-containing protein n=1 Tax=Zea mays TaxID=4577 RepID=A0A804UMP7_MAIZE